ncbi:serine/threonine-protein kinase [Saccharothrix stipae]
MGRQYDDNTIAEAFGVDRQNIEYLGTGAFGETWRIRQPDGTDTACKIIYSDGFPAERVDREVDGLRRIHHPRVVSFLEHTELTIRGELRQLLRFEYVPGGDLQHALRHSYQATAAETFDLLRGLLEAAQALHDAHVVHRDIKPGNIALRQGSLTEPVLLDLGLVKPLDASSLTEYPMPIGSPPYMAPEQVLGDRARNGADLWAIGVVTAEAVIGMHPYWKPHLIRDRTQWIAAQEKLAVTLPPSLPEPVQKVITKLLSFRKSQRGSARSALAILNGR